MSARPLRALYVFRARKRQLLERAATRLEPDTLLFGFNHLANFGVQATFHEPQYGAIGRRAARQLGRLGPDFLQLRTLPRFTGQDVVFLTGGWPLLLAARALPMRRRPKLIWLNMTLTNLLRRGGALGRLVALAVRQADRVVCVAQFQREYFQKALGLPFNRLPVILSGIDELFYDPTVAMCAPPGEGDQPTVLAAGRDAGRDYGTLIAALDGSRTNLRIVCSPKNLAGIRLGEATAVRFDIAPAALREEYAAASVVAVPTHGEGDVRGSDCSGTLVLLDALAMGKPAVITERASVHDYVRVGEDALVVPPADAVALRAAIQGLLSDRDAATRMAARGRERVLEGLTTRHFAARLASLFAEVAS